MKTKPPFRPGEDARAGDANQKEAVPQESIKEKDMINDTGRWGRFVMGILSYSVGKPDSSRHRTCE